MKLQSIASQQASHPLYVADSSITNGGTAQLALGQSRSRSHLILQNTSSGPLYFEFGSARATAVISGGVVTSVSVANAGMGFSAAPLIVFYGGGQALPSGTNSSYIGVPQPGGIAPSDVALAHCVMTGTVPNLSVASITVDHGGSGYIIAPYVFIYNSPLDPNGSAAPSATSGILLPSQGPPLVFDGTSCTTDPIAVYGATTGQTYICRWMD